LAGFGENIMNFRTAFEIVYGRQPTISEFSANMYDQGASIISQANQILANSGASGIGAIDSTPPPAVETPPPAVETPPPAVVETPLEEGIKQSYNEIFDRDPNQDEINEYVKEFGADKIYSAEEEQSLERRLFDSVSPERRAIVEETGTFNELDKKIEAEANLIPASQIIDLYQTEVGRDPNAEEIAFYQKEYGEAIDPREIRQFRSTPEAVTYRSGFDRAFKPLYEDLFRTSPTDQDIAEGRERFGALITPDEVNRFIRNPETMAKVQSGIRSGLGIPTQDFSNFNKAPVTTGPTATAGIERLRPTDTTGTMAGVFANPQQPAPDYSKFGAQMPDTFSDFGSLFGEQFKQDIRDEVKTEVEDAYGIPEESRMRTGGIASLGYKRGGEIDDGIMRYGIGGAIKKLYKGVKRIVKPIYKTIKPFVPYMLPPVIGVPLAAADAGFTDGKFDAKKAAIAAGKVIAANKIGEAMGSPSSTTPDGPSSSYFNPQSTAPSNIGQSGIQKLTGSTMDRLGRIGRGIRDRGIEALGGDFSGFKGTAVPAAAFVTLTGAEKGMVEAEKRKREQQGILAAREEDRKKYRDLASRLGQEFSFGYNKGGVSSLPARYLDGAGDGMSDSIKANIGDMQEARLADGEFVVPADVVADLGNGSSNAGAERLYSMMDRIRQARHGTTKQPPEVNVNKTLPA